MKNLIVILAILLFYHCSYGQYNIQDIPNSNVDVNSLNNGLQSRGNAYQSGVDQINYAYNRLMDMKLYNKENIKSLSIYQEAVKNERYKFAKTDFSLQNNLNSWLTFINEYREWKPIKDELDLLSSLFEEISRMKVSNPENYTSSNRYKEISEILNILETCQTKDIYNLRWKKLSTKQEASISTNSINQSTGDYYKQAQEKYKTKDYQAALEAINKCISINSNFAGFYYFRGFIFSFGINNYDEGIKDFTKAIQMDNKYKQNYFYRGCTYVRLQKYTESIKDFSDAINIDTNYLDAYFQRACAKDEAGDYLGSISDYNEIINKQGNGYTQTFLLATVYNNKGYAFVNLGKYKEALPLLNLAVELGPNESYIWGARGILHYKTKEYKKCIGDMNKAIELLQAKKTKALDLDKGTKYYFRGLAKINTGNKLEGCTDLSKAGELGKAEAYDEIKIYCK